MSIRGDDRGVSKPGVLSCNNICIHGNMVNRSVQFGIYTPPKLPDLLSAYL